MREGNRIALVLKTKGGVVRRLFLAVVVVAVSSLMAATLVASAGAKTKKAKPAKPTVIAATCKASEAIAAPAGSDGVVPPVSQGQAYGPASCGALGSGVASVSMTQQESGDVTGTWWHYLKKGAIYGQYDLTPGDSQPTGALSFAAASYTGTMTVTGGTAAYKGATGRGTSTCNTPDSVHFSCTEQLKVTLPPVVVAASKSK